MPAAQPVKNVIPATKKEKNSLADPQLPGLKSHKEKENSEYNRVISTTQITRHILTKRLFSVHILFPLFYEGFMNNTPCKCSPEKERHCDPNPGNDTSQL